VALVTGGGRGIGLATARAFAAEGWAVVVAELRPAAGRRVARELAGGGAPALFVQTDVADPAAARRAVRAARARFGRLDCVVNNAGVLEAGPLAAVPVSRLRRLLAVNLGGPLLVTRAALPALIRRRSGAIVNVASQLGRYGAAEFAAYCASKFGVVGFTEALADELASTGVRVWAVCPGLVDTPMARRAGFSGGDRRGLLAPEMVARVIVALATGRRRERSGAAVDVVA